MRSLAAVSTVALALTLAPTAGAESQAPPFATTVTRAQQVHASMTRDQRIGQLFMVATPADSVSPGIRSVIANQHVGNVILMGRSGRGADHTRSVTTSLVQLTEASAPTARVPLFISADQEGGNVQVLQGKGFSYIPTAVEQGKMPTSTLLTRSTGWGRQLQRAGVNQNLAPVLDTVPPQYKATNIPIGSYDREYGAYTSTVTTKGGAFRQGMSNAGVAASVKHFPGLGRVVDNTDTTSGVTDTVTTSTSGLLNPFGDAVDAGTPFVMMSSAIYTKIDASQPAVFSPTVIRTILRGQLGFGGVVMTDDVGNAKQLAAWSPGQRATKFIDAGGDMVLTARTDTLAQMVTAVRSKATTDPAFAAKVDAASLRVLEAKDDAHLLGTRMTPSGNFSPFLVGRIQAWLGKPVTKVWDKATIRSFQHRIGATQTGVWDSDAIRSLQLYLGQRTAAEYEWTPTTTRQLQRYLNTQL